MERIQSLLRVGQTRKLIPVNSTYLSQIGWQPPEVDSIVGALWVQFVKDGVTGFYQDVPKEIFEGLKDSPSKGRYLRDYVIKQGYTFTRTN